MHSHAFLMLSMLVLLALKVLRQLLLPYTGWINMPFYLFEIAAWIWIFVYLWLMQKRVYRQGWLLTSLKYACLGFCYAIFVSVGFMLSTLLSLTAA